jgi:prepilin-type N-terminal cleavage/methylation domain-containing protein/prepilin-type processing-associated H-X9-DG protein
VAAKARQSRIGFTLFELLVTIAIVGILIGLLIPAVQLARESARRVQCENNVRQQLLALQMFHATHRTFPAGRRLVSGGNYSWCVELLPYLDQEPLSQCFDKNRTWNDPLENWDMARIPLEVFRCPTSFLKFPGDTDYGGIMGSLLAGAPTPGVFDYENGVMIEVGNKLAGPISFGEITDGASNTILVAESSDRVMEQGGMWASGQNCFSHDNGQINVSPGEIFSWHSGGSYVGFADGNVRFLHRETAAPVVGSLCTRNGAEILGNF